MKRMAIAKTFHHDCRTHLLEPLVRADPLVDGISAIRWSVESGRLCIPIEFGALPAHSTHALQLCASLLHGEGPQ